MIASREVLAAVARQRRRPPRRRPASTRSTSSGTPIVPVSATATERGLDAERRGGGVAHRERVAVALLAGGGVRVAGVDDGGPDRGARRTRRGRPGPAPRRRRCGSAAAPSATSSASQASEADVGAAAVLQPAGDAGGAEAGRQLAPDRAPRPRGRVDPARAEEARRAVADARSRDPSVSVSPSIRFRFWIAWPAAPFQRLSIAAKASARPAARRARRGSGRGWCRARRARPAARRRPRRTARRA